MATKRFDDVWADWLETGIDPDLDAQVTLTPSHYQPRMDDDLALPAPREAEGLTNLP